MENPEKMDVTSAPDVDQVQAEPVKEKAGETSEEAKVGETSEGKPKEEKPKRIFKRAEEPTRPEDFCMPIEIIQTIQQLSSPKLSHTGQPCRPKPMIMENGRPVLPDLPPLQQCQQLQQIQTLIHYHEQQVKYRSYMQLELLRQLRKQLSDQMMLSPPRSHYEALAEAAKQNRLSPLSPAEKAQIQYFTSMAEWALEARSILQDKESPFYLLLIGRQINDLKIRLNEIASHEQFLLFAPQYAERIDYHRELIHTLNRRSYVSIE